MVPQVCCVRVTAKAACLLASSRDVGVSVGEISTDITASLTFEYSERREEWTEDRRKIEAETESRGVGTVEGVEECT